MRSFKGWRWSVLGTGFAAASLLFGTAGYAQIGGGVGTGVGTGIGTGATETAQTGTVRGTVTNIDFGQGLVQVRAGAQTVTLQARPFELANLAPGEVTSLTYANYLGEPWLVPQGGGLNVSAGMGGAFSQTGTLTGQVSSVDKSEGTITVRGTSFKVHPAQLEQVVPGQFVSLGYAQVGGVNWVASMQEAGGVGTGVGGGTGIGGGVGTGVGGGTGIGGGGTGIGGGGTGIGGGGGQEQPTGALENEGAGTGQAEGLDTDQGTGEGAWNLYLGEPEGKLLAFAQTTGAQQQSGGQAQQAEEGMEAQEPEEAQQAQEQAQEAREQRQQREQREQEQQVQEQREQAQQAQEQAQQAEEAQPQAEQPEQAQQPEAEEPAPAQDEAAVLPDGTPAPEADRTEEILLGEDIEAGAAEEPAFAEETEEGGELQEVEIP